MPTTIDLSGKIAIITGGSKGIGKEVSHALAKTGAFTIVIDKVVDEQSATELQTISPQNQIFCANTTDITSLEIELGVSNK